MFTVYDAVLLRFAIIMSFHLFLYISECSILFWDSFALCSKGVLNQHFNLTEHLIIFARSDGQKTGQFIS